MARFDPTGLPVAVQQVIADSILRRCVRPVSANGFTFRCGSRRQAQCPGCADLYQGDWGAILRSGVYDCPDLAVFEWLFVTLTAPSFGAVHHVPKGASSHAPTRACRCGVTHTYEGSAHLRGAPLDPASYDYTEAVAWNRDQPRLWNASVVGLRKIAPSLEFACVKEFQLRGAVHLHVLLRVPRDEARALRAAARGSDASKPAALVSTADAIRARLARVTTRSPIDGVVRGWGAQLDVRPFTVDTETAAEDTGRTIWYLMKSVGYTQKDLGTSDFYSRLPDDQSALTPADQHLMRLHEAAHRMRCSPSCAGGCGARKHRSLGAASHVVHVSRPTTTRPGWSFTGLTRTVQRAQRAAWVREAEQDDAGCAARQARRMAETPESIEWALEVLRRYGRPRRHAPPAAAA